MFVLLDLLIGYATAIVPTHVLSTAYYKNLEQNPMQTTNPDYFDYVDTLRSTPIFFAITNLIVLTIVDSIYSTYSWNPNTRFVVAGFVIAMIYSNIGRFILQIPKKVLKMEDPIWFNIYAVVAWILVYFVVYIVRDKITEC
jgi:amino acid transporter